MPVALFKVLDVHETRDFKCSDRLCNQAGFLLHKYTPKGTTHLETRFRYRRCASSQRPTPLLVPPLIAPPPLQRQNLQRQSTAALACASRRVKLGQYHAVLNEMQTRRPKLKPQRSDS